MTGSTAGIGLAIATLLAGEGAEVVVNGRSKERAEEAVHWIRRTHPKANVRGVAADLATAAGADEFVRQIPESDILVNNIGIFEPKPFEEIPDEDWLRFFESNVMSGVRLSRAYLPRMKQAELGPDRFHFERIGLQIPAEMIHYGMTKTAQIAIARGLAETCAGTGVTVNAVLPGPTASEGVKEFVGTLAEQNKQSSARVRAGIFHHGAADFAPETLCHARGSGAAGRFSVQPASAATNGAAMRVDGGTVKSPF